MIAKNSMHNEMIAEFLEISNHSLEETLKLILLFTRKDTSCSNSSANVFTRKIVYSCQGLDCGIAYAIELDVENVNKRCSSQYIALFKRFNDDKPTDAMLFDVFSLSQTIRAIMCYRVGIELSLEMNKCEDESAMAPYFDTCCNSSW